MRKEVTAVICVVLAVWFFFMGFELGIYKERKSNEADNSNVVTIPTASQPASTTEPATPPSTQPTAPSTEPSTAEPTVTENPANSTTKKPDDTSTEPTTKKAADPSSMSKEEIIAEMEKAFKTVKAEQNMTAVKSEEVKIQLTELSAQSLMSIVNSVIQRLAGVTNETYTVVNGTATGVDGEGKAIDGTFTVSDLLPPDGKDWKCDPAGVASATATKSGDSIVYEVKLNPEDTTFDQPVPTYTSGIYGYLDLTTLEVPTVTITDAKMHYDGTSVKVTVNGSGKVTEIHYNMPMNGYGEAKVALFNGNASFEGYDDEVWTFTY